MALIVVIFRASSLLGYAITIYNPAASLAYPNEAQLISNFAKLSLDLGQCYSYYELVIRLSLSVELIVTKENDDKVLDLTQKMQRRLKIAAISVVGIISLTWLLCLALVILCFEVSGNKTEYTDYLNVEGNMIAALFTVETVFLVYAYYLLRKIISNNFMKDLGEFRVVFGVFVSFNVM